MAPSPISSENIDSRKKPLSRKQGENLLPLKPGNRITAFSSLKNRNFRRFWIAMIFFYNAMQMGMVARGWLVYTLTDSAMALGLVTAGWGLPMVMFSLYGGVIADRFRKRNLMLITQVGLFLISLVITILIQTQLIAIWHLVLGSTSSGFALALGLPTRQAFVKELVGESDLLNSVALNSMAMNLCRIVSPALAGVLIKFIGIPGVYWLIVVSYILNIFMITIIPAGELVAVKKDISISDDLKEGWRFVWESPMIKTLMALAFIPILVALPYQMLMPVFAKTIFEAGETGLGLLMSAVGIGALIGSLMLSMLKDFQRKGFLMLIAGLLFGAFLVLFSQAGSLYLACFFLLFAGIGNSVFFTLTNTLIMENTPEKLTGRVMSFYMLTWGLMPLGTLPAGALAEAFGAPVTVTGGGLILLTVITAIFIFRPWVMRIK
ncbi:MAG: MFS transporter [Deltaproteobacteria bacterium]|nr:MFS transporter [Deltaproteobacteria bacterium]